MGGFPWIYILDTSPHTDFVLSLMATCAIGSMTLWWAMVVGLDGGTAALGILTLVLIGTTVYARFLWKRDQAKLGPRRMKAVKLRAPR